MTSKYGFERAEDRENAARIAHVRPHVAAWEARMALFLDEQQSLKAMADELSPQIEDVLWEWVAANTSNLYAHPFVARSQNGANWVVFKDDDLGSYVRNLWCVSLTQDWSKRGDPPMLALYSSSSLVAEEWGEMARVLGEVTGLPVAEPAKPPEVFTEEMLDVADVLSVASSIPERSSKPGAYYAFMTYPEFFTLALDWIRLEP